MTYVSLRVGAITGGDMNDSNTSSQELPLVDNGISAKGLATPRRTTGRSRLFLIPGALALLFIGGLLGLYFQPPGLQAVFRATGLTPGGGTDTPIAVAIQQIETAQEIAVVSEGDIVALGRIIPRGDVITVALPFGAGDARVAEIRVQEGETATQGQILAVLDSLPQLDGALQSSRANLAVAEATLEQIEYSTKAGRDEARASLERALATEKAAREELARTTALMERGVTTRAVLDSATARADEATRDVEKARATLSRFESNGGSGIQADIAVSRANLKAAQAQLVQAERDLEKAYVRAPIDGTVIKVVARPGERPDTDGVVHIGDTTQMTVEAEVYQTMIGRVTIGDPVTVTAEALSSPLSGQVSAIGLQIGRQSITSDDPAANTDARVVDVIVVLDPESSTRSQRLTNLQVVARIDASRITE